MNTKALKEWFTNFGTVFSILGFFATIYLGVWYVPTWLQESQNERIKNAENEILQSVKELIYTDSTFTLNELPTLVHAKEITLKQSFPLSLDDILTKTEESFMEDKFLPLTKRKELINKIERIKLQLPKESKTKIENQKAENKGTIWEIWLSIIGAIVSVILGIISTYIKFKSDKDKDAEIQNEIQDISSDKDVREYGYEFERNIEAALKNRPDIYLQDKNFDDRGIDIIFSKGDKQYFIEAKYLSKSKIGLNSFHQLAHYIKDKSGEAWLIYNTDLTPLVAQHINDFNKENKNISIKPIKVTNSKEFADKLNDILPK
jgi:putative Mn2+ efflux pump MntP